MSWVQTVVVWIRVRVIVIPVICDYDKHYALCVFDVHLDIGHATAFSSLNHNTVGVQQDGRMCRWTVWRGLNNTGKTNMMFSVLILTIRTIVCVASKVRQDTAMLVKCLQNVFVIPSQTYEVQ